MTLRTISLHGAVALLLVGCGGATTTPVAPAPTATMPTSAPVPTVDPPVVDAGAPVAAKAAPTGPVAISHPTSASAALAVDDENVYFVDLSDGTLNAWPKDGSGVEATIYTLPGAPVMTSTLSLSGGSIFLIERPASDLESGSALKIEKGGATLPLARKIKDQLKSIAADSSFLYWANDAFIMKVSTSGGTPGAVGGGGGKNPTSVAVDDKSLYWTADGYVFSLNKSGGAPTVFATGQDKADNIFLDANNVYWSSGKKIVMEPKSGAPPAVLATSDGPVLDLAASAGHVYWVGTDASGAGVVMQMEMDSTGSAAPFATNQATPIAIAVDATNVYWTNKGTEAKQFKDGAVMKQAKATHTPPAN